ncbi:hypothetical protein [Falsibacillus pallidus]|uniref:DUF4367 domain-containing protein n=1 Tax=Falsibacillus pallidus TaxID=493781 RepID=A0A370GBA8_9BACI|nr:hypothetical protein [Falsibacillus pallidus]RDI41085.1 hypothetical protein DFR59_11089 [Falsibacillus pallidus]
MEQELKDTLKNVQGQIRYPKEIHIERILKKKKRAKLNQAALIVVILTLFLTLIPNVTPSWAELRLFGTSPKPAHPYSEYLVHNGYYYIPSVQKISKEQLETKLGTISRNGDWKFLREGDTTQYPPNSNYYSIKGKSPDKYIAVDIMAGPARKHKIEGYQVLKRAKLVEKPDVKSIYGGKNDSMEVNAAYENIRNIVPFLRILQSPDLKMTTSVLRNDGARYHVKLGYKPAPHSSIKQTVTLPGDNHVTEKFLWIQEYPEKYLDGNHPDYNGDFQYDSIQQVGEFSSNGITWASYQVAQYDSLFSTKINGIIYEVSCQGFSVEEMKKLLETFTIAPKK